MRDSVADARCVNGLQGKPKCRALAPGRLGPDGAAVAFHDLAADRQPDSRARVDVPCMQSLEHLEYPVEVRRIDPNAVIGNGKLPLRTCPDRLHRHPRLPARIELDRVADKVLKQLGQLHPVAQDRWQGLVRDLRAGVGDGLLQVDQGIPQGSLALGGLELAPAGADARKVQQPVQQRLHPPGAVNRELNEVVGV